MAAGFSGSGTTADRVECGTPDVPANTPTFSMCAWNNPFTGHGDFVRIGSKATGTSANAHIWMLGMSSSTGYRSRVNAGGSTTTEISGSATLDAWNHFAVVYDGTNQENFVDAVSAGSGTNSGDVGVNASAEYWIGNQPPTGTDDTEVWDGTLEDIRVFARNLLNAELVCIVNSNGHDGIVHEMILRHPLNDNSSGTIGSGADRARGIGSLQQDGIGVNSPTWEVGENIMAPRRRYR